jgi:glutathione S-transferase
MPEDPALRSKVREYMWSAEGTFLMHGFAIWTSRSAAPPMMDKSDFTKIEVVLAGKVQSGFDWLENELAGGNGKLLVGNSVAAADTTLAFSIQFILAQNLGMADRPWTRIQKWIHDLVRHRSSALGTEPPLRMYAESGCGRINRHEWEEPNEGLILGNQYWLC